PEQISRSLRFLPGQQEDGERPRPPAGHRFQYNCRGPVPDRFKPCIFQLFTQEAAVEPGMEDTGIVVMECSAVRVKVRNTEKPGRFEDPGKLPEQRADVQDVVE